MSTEKRNDEIDLIEVCLKIYIFFKKNFLILFISGIIGGAVGYSTKFYTKNSFESSMLIESYTLSEDIIIEYISNLQTIIADRNYDYLSAKTGSEKEILSDLEIISAERLSYGKNNKDLDYIKIYAKSKSNVLLSTLSDCLLEYLKQEAYVRNEIEIFIDQNNVLIEKIDTEILLLEELQKKNLTDAHTKPGVNIYNEQTSFHKDLLGLIKEKQLRQKRLKFATPFRVIEDFIIYQKPVSKNRKHTVSSAILFIITTILVLIVIELNKKVK